jgi:predicted RNA binding protein YcfA (HicA-like mRNA interferase family)
LSPRLPAVEANDLVRVARKLGFILDRQKGSHAVDRAYAPVIAADTSVVVAF